MATVGGKTSSEDERKPKEAVALAGKVDQFSLVESEFQAGPWELWAVSSAEKVRTWW